MRQSLTAFSWYFLCAWILFSALTNSLVMAEEVDPNVLLKQVDDNLWSNTKIITGRLIIDNGRRERVLVWENWMQGVERSFSHYLSPPREKGTKMLKVKNKLWLYTPRTDRKILIAGHLMRQSMMGSDLSYEDMMEDKKLSRAYDAQLEACAETEELPCAVLYLLAHDKSTAYRSRRLWVDPLKKIVWKENMYAKSGKLLKTVEFLDYEMIGKRLFPKKMIFRDKLKNNTKTTYMFDSIEFDVEIPPETFSQRQLKR